MRASRIRGWLVFTFATVVGSLIFGCSMNRWGQGSAERYGVVYYLDGAGGGSLLANWGYDVGGGLSAAGYPGALVNYSWQTGLGPVVDQEASVGYKRWRAAGLARKIVEHTDQYPGTDVSVIGLSAGTAVAVFALEALPQDRQVHDVFLLASSMSAHYDLTAALRHVQNQVYVFTSDSDPVLGVLVPLTGTADREFCGHCAAGLRGFHIPPGASNESRRLYAKVRSIPVGFDRAMDEDYGGHTQTVSLSFVRDRIAPVLIRDGSPPALAAARPRAVRGSVVVATRPSGK
jgi:hypothetical protein